MTLSWGCNAVNGKPMPVTKIYDDKDKLTYSLQCRERQAYACNSGVSEPTRLFLLDTVLRIA